MLGAFAHFELLQDPIVLRSKQEQPNSDRGNSGQLGQLFALVAKFPGNLWGVH
jgi:hypothetical protein